MNKRRLVFLGSIAGGLLVILLILSTGGDWVPDVHEPNDDPEHPTAIGLAHRISSVIYKPGDVDWFEFDIEVASRLELDLSTDDSGAIEVTVFDPDERRIMARIAKPGTYLLRFENTEEFDTYPVRYSLGLRLEPEGEHALLGCATTVEELRALIAASRGAQSKESRTAALRPVRPGHRELTRINDLELERPLTLHPTSGRLSIVADDGLAFQDAVALAAGGDIPPPSASYAVHFRFQDALSTGSVNIEERYYQWLARNWQNPIARACYSRIAGAKQLSGLLPAWERTPSPKFWSIWALAWGWHRSGDSAKARTYLDTLRNAARASEHAWSAWLEATLLDERSDSAEIARLLKRSEQYASPRDAVLQRAVGRRWIEIGQAEAGERLIFLALDQHPTDMRSHRILRDHFLATDKLARATTHQELLVSLEGPTGTALIDLCRCYMRLGLAETCRRILGRVIEGSPHLKNRCETLLNSIGR